MTFGCMKLAIRLTHKLLSFWLLVQVPLLGRLQMSSSCICTNTLGNAALIPKQKLTLQNITLSGYSACHMQGPSIADEKPIVDIEVSQRNSFFSSVF